MYLHAIAGETDEQLGQRVAAEWERRLRRTNAPTAKAFDESQHPRDYHGRFAAGEGRSDREVVVNSLKNKLDVALEKLDTTPERKAEYRAAYDRVLDSMTDAAVLAFRGNVKDIQFFENQIALTHEVAHHYKLPAGVTKMAGAFVPTAHMLYLDGGATMKSGEKVEAHEVYAHEMSHAIDVDGGSHNISMSGWPEWRQAWEKEIVGDRNGTARLSDYARTNVKEGWAEFGRLIHTNAGKAPQMKQIEDRFPECYKIWKDRGFI